jgi:hypothetical protein
MLKLGIINLQLEKIQKDLSYTHQCLFFPVKKKIANKKVNNKYVQYFPLKG